MPGGRNHVPVLPCAERKDRRRRMAEAVAGGEAAKDVMQRFNVSRATVTVACREFNVRRSVGRPRGSHWATVDWTRRVPEIAAELGLDQCIVYRAKRRYGPVEVAA